MTTYAHIATDGTIGQVGRLPALWFDGTRWHDWRGDPETWATQPADFGWLPVVEVPRPADTAETTSDPAPPALADGVPVQQWTIRPWTPDELAAQAAQAAREADRLAVRTILDTINANIDEARAAKAAAQAVLDSTAPTNVAQVWVKVKDTARALKDADNALISVGQGVKDLAKYAAQ